MNITIKNLFAFILLNCAIVDSKNILIIGSGAREHAIAWKISQSPLVEHIYIAPGNGGTATEQKCSNINIAIDDISALVEFAAQHTIDLTIVGPELPLSLGIVDRFNDAGLLCFGPIKKAAQLESSKRFTKEFCNKYNIPTAHWQTFDSFDSAKLYVEQAKQFPLVIKADGLANGKGVIIAANEDEALEALKYIMLEKKFGSAGNTVVIEEFLEGKEISFIVVTDGKTIVPLEIAQDYKKRDEDDKGPNTGGMGAYCPVPWVSPELKTTILHRIIEPTLRGLKKEGIDYCGFLYAGLMITKEGPVLLEYNCRLGDPEAQVILMRLQNDLFELCMATVERHLGNITLSWNPSAALCVVIASKGYPEQYVTGQRLEGLSDLSASTKIFHAATQNINGELRTIGGRVLSVTGIGTTFRTLRTQLYSEINKIIWPTKFYRTDIGKL